MFLPVWKWGLSQKKAILHNERSCLAWRKVESATDLAPPLSNQISLIHGSRIKWKSLSCQQFRPLQLPYFASWGRDKICRNKIVDSRAFLSWSLIHGSNCSGLIKLGPGWYWYKTIKLRNERHHEFRVHLTLAVKGFYRRTIRYVGSVEWHSTKALCWNFPSYHIHNQSVWTAIGTNEMSKSCHTPWSYNNVENGLGKYWPKMQQRKICWNLNKNNIRHFFVVSYFRCWDSDLSETSSQSMFMGSFDKNGYSGKLTQ